MWNNVNLRKVGTVKPLSKYPGEIENQGGGISGNTPSFNIFKITNSPWFLIFNSPLQIDISPGGNIDFWKIYVIFGNFTLYYVILHKIR